MILTHHIYKQFTEHDGTTATDTQPRNNIPDSKIHGANMGPTWVQSSPGGPHGGPINLAIRDGNYGEYSGSDDDGDEMNYKYILSIT